MRKMGDQVETAGVVRLLGNPGYLCYPPNWDMATIKSYSRNYSRRSHQEAESPKAALAIHKITRPMPFKWVPEGFYFRTPYYELVKKIPVDEETRANALTTDLDVVRAITIQDAYWCFPPKYTVDDITSGPRFESLREAEDPKQFLRGMTAKRNPIVTNGYDYADVSWQDISRLKELGLLDEYDGRAFRMAKGKIADDIEMALDMRRLRWYRWITVEAEDPKSVFHLAKAALGRWVLARGFDAYGEVLPDTMYFHYNDSNPEFKRATWTKNFSAATQFKSEEEAWNALKTVFGDNISYWKAGVDTQALNPRDVKLEAKQRFPFDLLDFPTDASVLASKLLDLDDAEKTTVL